MTSQASNMLGALSLVVSGRITDATRHGGRLVGEDAATLVLLGVQAMTVKALAEATGVTHSGAVRMADRLEAAGLVRRDRGPDGRTVVLSLTPEGATERTRALDNRAAVVEPLLGALAPADRRALAQLLRSLLTACVATPLDAVSTCRLCDEDSCVPRGCPVEERYQLLTGT